MEEKEIKKTEGKKEVKKETKTNTNKNKTTVNSKKDTKSKTTKNNVELKREVKEQIPDGFVKKSNLNKKEYGFYNGRKYQILKNGFGMWADTGTAFKIEDLN